MGMGMQSESDVQCKMCCRWGSEGTRGSSKQFCGNVEPELSQDPASGARRRSAWLLWHFKEAHRDSCRFDQMGCSQGDRAEP